MSGQMMWKSVSEDSEKILHVRRKSTDPWIPYHKVSEYKADYPIPGGSKGWRTYHALRERGWKLVTETDSVTQIQTVSSKKNG